MTRNTRIALASALVALSLFAMPGSHASPIPPTPELWIVEADGSGERMLVERPGDFDWSPDGSKLVTIILSKVTVIDVVSGGETPLTADDVYASEVAWSPNGSAIAFTFCDSAGSCGLATTSPDGGPQRTLVESQSRSPVGISWSPDSSEISYVTGVGDGVPGHVAVVDVATSTPRDVSLTDAYYTETDWSATGGWISFYEWKEDFGYGLRAVRPDGSEEKTLSGALTYVQDAEWSPIGEDIAFTGDSEDSDAGRGIYVSSPSDPQPRLVVAGAGAPTWSPDGMRIAYSSSGDLYVEPRAGGERTPLTDEDLRDDRAADWSPDGALVAFLGTEVKFYCGYLPYPAEARIVGTEGDDVLEGTQDADVIVTRGGDDEVHGLGGDDVICGGDGDDVIHGDEGADVLLGDAGHDVLNGGDGGDSLEGVGGDDRLDGGPGTDTVSFYSLAKKVRLDLELGAASGQGSDVIAGIENAEGSRKADVLAGSDGPNRLVGAGFLGNGDDHDVLVGRGGPDVLSGLLGDDRLRGGRGPDELRGGDGDDDCRGGPGRDWIREC